MKKTEKDNWELLTALQKHSTDIPSLLRDLPNWSEPELQLTINRFRGRAERKITKDEEFKGVREASLTHWLELSEQVQQLQGTSNKPYGRPRFQAKSPPDNAPLLSKVMMYAACFEDYTQSKNPGDPNYTEIYRYLSQILEGKEPTMIRAGSAAKIQEMLAKIRQLVLVQDPSRYQRLCKLQNLSFSCTPTTVQENDPPDSGVIELKGEGLECPLFEDAEDDLQSRNIGPEDPYYEVKREEALRKLESKQQAAASIVMNMPGLNPLNLPADVMVQPQIPRHY